MAVAQQKVIHFNSLLQCQELLQQVRIVAFMTEQQSPIVANMRARAEQCRRLASALTDRGAATVLLKMAEEVEIDIARLEGAGGDGEGVQLAPNPLPPPIRG